MYKRQKDGYYQIIAGERRWRAARQAGLEDIPAMVLEAEEDEVMELALIENLQRQDLNPIEEAEGYERLMKQFGLTQEQVAKRVVKSRSAVANALRLLALPTEVRTMVSEGEISGGHARAVLAVNEADKRVEACLLYTSYCMSAGKNEVKTTCAQLLSSGIRDIVDNPENCPIFNYLM